MAAARVVLLGLALLGVGAAQQRLVVNGADVPGLTNTLVRGRSFVAAETLADTLGARFSYSTAEAAATFEVSGHLLRLEVADGPGSLREGGLSLDGRPVAGEGAVAFEGVVYVPVRPVVVALGGAITYLEADQTVMVVFPRARVERAELTSTPRRGLERFVLDFQGLSPLDTYYNRALGTLQLRFSRADVAAAKTFEGTFFSSAILTPNAGFLDFRVTLRPGYRFDSYTTPQTGGFSVVVDLLPDIAAAEPAAVPVFVIDPGHGGEDPGLTFELGREATLALAFAERLQAALETEGIASRLTRQEDAGLSASTRSQAGIGADLFVSLHGADLVPGQFNLYYLGDSGSAETLDLAVRQNAARAAQASNTDALRRRVLLGLVPDLAAGQRAAQQLARELEHLGGYRVNTLAAVPLAVLDGAAGRGVLFEFSPQDLSDDRLPTMLAAAFATYLGGTP